MFQRRTVWPLLAVLVLAPAACFGGAGSEEETRTSPEASQAANVTDETPERLSAPATGQLRCREDGLEAAPLVLVTTPDPVALAHRVARRTHRCAPIAVVASTEGWAATLAVPIAVAEDAPLLLVDPDDPAALADALDELDVGAVIAVGVPAAVTDHPGIELLAGPAAPGPATGTGDGSSEADDGSPPVGRDALPDDLRLALTVAAYLDTQSFVAVPHDDLRGRTAAALRADPTTAVLPVPSDHEDLANLAIALHAMTRVHVIDAPTAASTTSRLLTVGIDAEVVDGERWPPGHDTSWLVDPDDAAAGAVAVVAATGRGEAVLPIDAGDLRAGAANATRVRETAPERAVLLGDITPHALWQYHVIRDGPTLPTGGFRLFEDERVVALRLDDPLDASALEPVLERLQDIATSHDHDDRRIALAFEVPAPGNPVATRLDATRAIIERAAQDGLHVLLAVPPGSGEALPQLEPYAELLAEPHVGLSLAAGSDGAASPGLPPDEIRAVAGWLARSTREERLPQKLLVLRGTSEAPPTDDGLTVPPELALVYQLDLASHSVDDLVAYSDATGVDGHDQDPRAAWGLRVGLPDADDVAATAERIVELEPTPLVITYH